MRRIRAGIIGTGLIGPVHIGALKRMPYVDVHALADAGDDLAQKRAKDFDIPRFYGDADSLIADDQIDAVHICVPNHLHYPIAKKALLAGKHVICEKPLAVTAEEALELAETAERSGLVHAVHFNLRYYPLMRQLQQMVSRGDFGRIFSVHGSYLQDWLFYDTDYNWRLETNLSGPSRAVADIGSHWMDLIEYVSGLKIRAVYADLATMHPVRKKPKQETATYANMMAESGEYTEVPISTEDFAAILFRFENGERGVLTLSQVSAGRKNRLAFELDGSRQSASWESEQPNQLWIGRRDKPNEIMLKDPSLAYPEAAGIMTLPGGHNEGFHDASLALLSEVYEDIRRGSASKPPAYPSFADGCRELQIIELILASSRDQCWKELP